jgi:predicted phage terminase large subunit-like protein
MERLRGPPGVVEAEIKRVAELDGKHVGVRMAQDPGSAGKGEVSAYVRLLDGYDIRAKTESGPKVIRAAPVSAQAHPRSTGGLHGRFTVVKGEWNEAFYQELEAFPDGDHDDIVDTLSGAFDWHVNGVTNETPTIGVRIISVERPQDDDEINDAYSRLSDDYF